MTPVGVAYIRSECEGVVCGPGTALALARAAFAADEGVRCVMLEAFPPEYRVVVIVVGGDLEAVDLVLQQERPPTCILTVDRPKPMVRF